MQIEFERRVQLIDPTLIVDKLTSDVIFSFLNAYTERYVKSCFLQNDAVEDNSKALVKITDAIKSLLTRSLIDIANTDEYNTDKFTTRIELPSDYFLYVRSNSVLSKNYKTENEITDPTKYVITTNKLLRSEQIEQVLPTYYNKAIIPNPYVQLDSGNEKDFNNNTLYLNIIHDEYTIIKNIDLVYYRKPKRFDVIGVDGVNVLNYCELPEDVHMEIVEGAVNMFITEARFRLSKTEE